MSFANENFPSRRSSDCCNLETQPAPRQLFKRSIKPTPKVNDCAPHSPAKTVTPKSKRSSESFRRPFFLYIIPYLHSSPEIARRVQDGFDDAGADGEVTEAFVVEAVLRPVFDPAVDDFEDFGFGDVFFKEAWDAGAFSVAACVEVVATDGFADQTDFGEHGAAAAVGAAGDA